MIKHLYFVKGIGTVYLTSQEVFYGFCVADSIGEVFYLFNRDFLSITSVEKMWQVGRDSKSEITELHFKPNIHIDSYSAYKAIIQDYIHPEQPIINQPTNY